jgi:hypothetical protein
VISTSISISGYLPDCKWWLSGNHARHRLLGNGETTSGPLPAASGLSLAGFFFPLFQPMLRMGGQPAIRQQGFQGSYVAWGDGCDPAQHVGQVRPHVHAVPSGALYQCVERRSRLATILASEEQVVLPTNSDGPQKPFNHIVVYWNPAVLCIH